MVLPSTSEETYDFQYSFIGCLRPDNVGEYDELFVSGKDKLYINAS